MKKKSWILIGVVALTVVLAGLSIITAIELKNIGTQPVAPSVPKSKPQAAESVPATTVPAAACKKTISIAIGPTSTPVPGPTSTPEPGATSTPVPGPTNTPPPGPHCVYLNANPSSGTAPLKVHFTSKGYDPTRVKAFKIAFGDGGTEEVKGSFNNDYEVGIDHTYSGSGAFKAKMEIMDDGDHYRTRTECEVLVNVQGGAAQVTSKPVTPTEVVLPKAGIKMPTLGGIITGFLLIAIGAALVF